MADASGKLSAKLRWIDQKNSPRCASHLSVVIEAQGVNCDLPIDRDSDRVSAPGGRVAAGSVERLRIHIQSTARVRQYAIGVRHSGVPLVRQGDPLSLELRVAQMSPRGRIRTDNLAEIQEKLDIKLNITDIIGRCVLPGFGLVGTR